jgi:hypothetical protein
VDRRESFGWGGGGAHLLADSRRERKTTLIIRQERMGDQCRVKKYINQSKPVPIKESAETKPLVHQIYVFIQMKYKLFNKTSTNSF